MGLAVSVSPMFACPFSQTLHPEKDKRLSTRLKQKWKWKKATTEWKPSGR